MFRRIANLFKGNATAVAKFSEANEDMVKSGALEKYHYLHFATHGIVDESDPELSRIFLQSGSQDDQGGPGKQLAIQFKRVYPFR